LKNKNANAKINLPIRVSGDEQGRHPGKKFGRGNEKSEDAPAGKRFVISTSTEVPLWNLQPSQMSPRKNFPSEAALPGRSRLASATLVMGVLNVTPDSFSDGGSFLMQRAQCSMRWQCRAMERTSLMLARNRPGLDRKEISVAEGIEAIAARAGTATRQTEDPYFGGHAKTTVVRDGARRWAEIVNDISGCAPIGARAHLCAGAERRSSDAHARDARTMQKGRLRVIDARCNRWTETSIPTAKKYGVRSRRW